MSYEYLNECNTNVQPSKIQGWVQSQALGAELLWGPFLRQRGGSCRAGLPGMTGRGCQPGSRWSCTRHRSWKSKDLWALHLLGDLFSDYPVGLKTQVIVDPVQPNCNSTFSNKCISWHVHCLEVVLESNSNDLKEASEVRRHSSIAVPMASLHWQVLHRRVIRIPVSPGS